MLKLDDGRAGDGQARAAAAKRLRMSPAAEPTSVLYNRSPSPPTSSSAPEPPPISAEDWEAVLSGDMAAAPPSHQSQDSSCFLRWIMDDDDAAFNDDPFLAPPPPPCQDDPAVESFLLQPTVADEPRAPGAVADELLETAHRAYSGDTTGAREILTRLNHRRPPSPPPPPGQAVHPPPLLRDALLRRLDGALPPSSSSLSSASPAALDVALKVAAHKALADASPATVQFASFTCTQAILDALLGGARVVHVVDLDVGLGARWPPLMQELALQRPPPAMKLTALLVSPPDTMELELRLARDSLTRFAADLGIRFDFNAVAFDPTNSNPSSAVGGVAAAPGEAVAVHLPVGCPPAPATLLRALKQIQPAVVVCVDDHGGCQRGDLPLPRHALIDATAAFLESLDAAGAPAGAVAKFEHYILRPRLDRMMLTTGGDGSRRMLPPCSWQAVLASAGFAPVQLSAAAEAQAECIVRRAPTPGFNVHKRQAALALRWHQADLVTVSAWRCSST